ncbi:Protein OS-9 [Coemansia sp. RSA 2320]|nr:Protein OS-9 [Coemansia sp. RSA 2320]
MKRWHLLLLAVATAAVKCAVTAGSALNPAALMEDLRGEPRFRLKVLGELIAESELPAVVARLKRLSIEAEASHTEDSVAYDPLVLRVGRTWQLLCQAPRVNHTLDGAAADSTSATEFEPADSEADSLATVARGLELLEPLRERCLAYVGVWWTFEYCHAQHVRQFHRLAPDKKGRVEEMEFRLGVYSRRKQAGAHDTAVRREGRKRFLTQVWGGGTLCDMTRQPREVEVQFHCDPSGPERIVLVEEVEVCRYVLVVNTPRLCADVRFYDPAASAVHDIRCQHVLPDADYALAMAEADSDAAPLAALPDVDADDDVPLLSLPAARPQVVVSLADPQLARLNAASQDTLRKLLAAALDAPDLRVRFSQPDADSPAPQPRPQKSASHDEL